MTIDKALLKDLASDPSQSAESISEALGFGAVANFYYALGQDADAKTIYSGGRAQVKAERKAAKGTKRAEGSMAKKKATANTPPRKTRANGNSKGGLNDLLLRKLVHEFEHIAIYDEISEHFDEVHNELRSAV